MILLTQTHFQLPPLSFDVKSFTHVIDVVECKLPSGETIIGCGVKLAQFFYCRPFEVENANKKISRAYFKLQEAKPRFGFTVLPGQRGKQMLLSRSSILCLNVMHTKQLSIWAPHQADGRNFSLKMVPR
jgi:hypothetical protein